MRIVKTEKKSGDYQNNDKPAPRLTEPGVYVAQLVKVSLKKSEKHPDWKPGILMVFRVVQEEGLGAFASDIVSSNWNPGNKLDEWLKALGVEDAEIGDDLVVDNLRGNLAKINVEINDKGFAKVIGLYKMKDKDYEKVVESELYQNKARKNNDEVTVSRSDNNEVNKSPSDSSNTGSDDGSVKEGKVTQDDGDEIPF